jgi:phenylalanyl-tRNA synthetase beta chain
MKVPIQWLADFVAVEMPTEELAHGLTMAGLKVESIERPGERWQDVLIGEVISIRPHPTSRNPLHVAEVQVGDRSTTIVTGAQNVSQGDRVPVVMIGGLLPHGPDGGPIVIEPRPMAGITSQGMLCSQRELGLSEEHWGIFVLPPDAPVGKRLADIMGGDVLEIETNPNRPDTLSIIGIAREVAAITKQQLILPDLDAVSDRVTFVDEASIQVDVEAPILCPRYSAIRIDGVRTLPSPWWIASRLEAAGMRPINVVVDITNYVMLEYGQPMHAFDETLIAGNRIVVRRAREGEKLRTLDGGEHVLNPENLVIADEERAVGIAGVMGGENSEIRDETTSLVLESANFDPVSVRRTAKQLGLRTESSSRFEKGLPPEQTVLGIKRYLQLLDQCLGTPIRAWRTSDVLTSPPERRTVKMRMRDLHRLIGLPIPKEDAAEALSLLGFEVAVRDSVIEAEVPFWRRADVEESADLVEEVARLVGYDKVPATLPLHTMPPEPLPNAVYWESEVRDRMLAAGVNESLTHSLTSPENLARLVRIDDGKSPGETFELWSKIVPNAAGVSAHGADVAPVVLINPATRDRRMLRLTLLPGLLDALARNLRHTDERVAFFEIDRVAFRRPKELAYERRTLAVALTGNRRPRSWINPGNEPYTFYDMKGILTATLDALQIRSYEVEAREHPALHPGRAAIIRVRGEEVGHFGELHPEVADAFEIEGWPVQVAELDLDTVCDLASTDRTFRPLPRYPAAYRDIAVVVDQDVAAESVIRVVRRAGGDLLEIARIFDVYSGDPLGAGQKSIAIGMTFRAPGATLTQDQVGEAMSNIVAVLREELNAALRE